MTANQIRDKAYRIATGNHLTKSFTYNQFQRADISKFLWEPLSDWSEDQIVSHINCIAEEIIQLTKEIKGSV